MCRRCGSGLASCQHWHHYGYDCGEFGHYAHHPGGGPFSHNEFSAGGKKSVARLCRLGAVTQSFISVEACSVDRLIGTRNSRPRRARLSRRGSRVRIRGGMRLQAQGLRISQAGAQAPCSLLPGNKKPPEGGFFIFWQKRCNANKEHPCAFQDHSPPKYLLMYRRLIRLHIFTEP